VFLWETQEVDGSKDESFRKSVSAVARQDEVVKFFGGNKALYQQEHSENKQLQ